MDYQSRNGEQAGDLIHWTDYTANNFEEPQEYIGIILDYSPREDIFVVLCEGNTVAWLAWQCEVVSCK